MNVETSSNYAPSNEKVWFSGCQRFALHDHGTGVAGERKTPEGSSSAVLLTERYSAVPGSASFLHANSGVIRN